MKNNFSAINRAVGYSALALAVKRESFPIVKYLIENEWDKKKTFFIKTKKTIEYLVKRLGFYLIKQIYNGENVVNF